MHLLTLYKLGMDLYPFHADQTVVADLFNDIVLQNKVLLSARGIELTVDVPDDLLWEMDSDLINGVMGHAINNAIKYTRNALRLAVVEHDGWLELRVEDNGAGYPARMLVDGSKGAIGVDFESGSTGLGLHFADQVAQLHQRGERCGSIRLENGGQFGGGCFVLTLP
jgi:signal transduction histidine kinase